MATGIYTRVFDTVVSGNSLLSNLSGEDVKALEFKGAQNNCLPLALAASTQINVDQLVQSALPGGLVIKSSGAFSVLLGTDSATQAAAYVSLFNLRSTNDVRVLTFVNGGTILNGGVSNTISLESAGKTNVQVKLSNGAVATTAIMFTTGKASGGTGFEREVFLSATTLTSGSEVVQFTVGATGNAAL